VDRRIQEDRQKKASDTEPPTGAPRAPAVWIPYGLSRSAGNPLLDSTAGKFGPFAGQMFVAELTNGCVVRADLEKVEGEWQGSALQFRRGTGSANRIAFAPDGTMIVGLTNRGWGGAPPADGLARVKWTGRVPMEMEHVRLEQDGFLVSFTLPLAADCKPAAANAHLVQYDYNSWWGLRLARSARDAGRGRGGRGRRGTEGPARARAGAQGGDVRAARLRRDRRREHGERREDARSAAASAGRLHDQPDARHGRRGARREDGRAAALARGHGGGLGHALRPPLDRGFRGRRVAARGRPHGSQRSGAAGRASARRRLGRDAGERARRARGVEQGPARRLRRAHRLHGPKGSNSGVYFMGRYEVQILDSFGKKEVDFGDCGGIYEGMEGDQGFPGSAPKVNASNAPGEWQRFDVRFRAPRFDAGGKKVANAKFEWVKLNGTLIQENVEVSNPTRAGHEGPEAAFGPLMLQGDHGPVAFKKVRLKRLDPPQGDPATASANAQFVKIFDGKTLDGWKQSGNAKWSDRGRRDRRPRRRRPPVQPARRLRQLRAARAGRSSTTAATPASTSARTVRADGVARRYEAQVDVLPARSAAHRLASTTAWPR
jgi:hypothetical protein